MYVAYTALARLCCIAIWKLQYSSPSVSMYTAIGFGNIRVCVCSIGEPYMTKPTIQTTYVQYSERT